MLKIYVFSKLDKMTIPWSCKTCGKKESPCNMMTHSSMRIVSSNGVLRSNCYSLGSHCVACQINNPALKTPECVACGETNDVVGYVVKNSKLRVSLCSACAKPGVTEGMPFILQTRKKNQKAPSFLEKGESLVTMLFAQVRLNMSLLDDVEFWRQNGRDIVAASRETEYKLQKKIEDLEAAAVVARSVEEGLLSKVASLEEKIAQITRHQEEEAPEELFALITALENKYEEVMGEPMPVQN